MNPPYEAKWYAVLAREIVPEQDPPPCDHPAYDRIVAIQAAARHKKLAAAKMVTVKMWGPQIEFLLRGESYEVTELSE